MSADAVGDEVVDVLRAARAIGLDVPAVAPDLVRGASDRDRPVPMSVLPALDATWSSAFAAVRRASRAGAPPSPRLLDVLERVGELREDAYRESLAARDARLRGVRDALTELRRARDVDELERDAAAALGFLGFDRGIVSRLVDGVWVPSQVAVERDPAWAVDILRVGRAHPRSLTPELPEATLARRGGTIVVDRVQDRSDVYLEVARSSRSTVYAASRIPGHGRPFGFVHGDRYYRGERPGDGDRAALAAFAEGLGHAFAHVEARHRARTALGRVDALRGALSVEDPWAGWGPEVPDRAADPPPQAPTVLDRLTDREREVLSCVASGGTNYSIARRLGISEGTVKTHVKNILAKLEVSNRAQAVARWWNPGHGA